MANNQATIGFMDLISIAVGQIIGAGVMVMSISGLGMTGRAVNVAFIHQYIIVVNIRTNLIYNNFCIKKTAFQRSSIISFYFAYCSLKLFRKIFIASSLS